MRRTDYRLVLLSILIALLVYISVGNVTGTRNNSTGCVGDLNDDSWAREYAIMLEAENARLNNMLHEYRTDECVKTCGVIFSDQSQP